MGKLMITKANNSVSVKAYDKFETGINEANVSWVKLYDAKGNIIGNYINFKSIEVLEK